MKKILLVLLVVLLVGCSQKNAEKLVNIGDIDGCTIYISTPSGAIYIASGSQLFKYTNENGKQKNINDYKGE